MKKRIILLVIVFVAVMIAILVGVQPAGAARTTLKLSGNQGLGFKATIKADGVEMKFSGILPATVEVTGRFIDCSFQKTEAEGTITLNVATQAGSGSVATFEPQGGVRASVYKKLFSSGFMTTTF